MNRTCSLSTFAIAIVGGCGLAAAAPTKPWFQVPTSVAKPSNWVDADNAIFVPGVNPFVDQYSSGGSPLSLTQRAQRTAEITVQQILARTTGAHSVGTPPEKVAILLQNFGGLCGSSWIGGPCFLLDNDRLPVVFPGVPDGLLPSGVNRAALDSDRHAGVWYRNARPEILAWTNAYVTALQSELSAAGLPNPTRFMLDVEGINFGFQEQGKSASYTIKQLAVARVNDSDPSSPLLWDTEPVPGFGGLTLKQLYEEHRDYWNNPSHWRPLPFLSTPPFSGAPWFGSALNSSDGVLETLGLTEDRNLQYWNWYSGVARTAIDGAMNESLFQPLRFAFPGVKFGSCEWLATDGEQDIFGFFRERTANNHGAPTTVFPTQNDFRGFPYNTHEGARVEGSTLTDECNFSVNGAYGITSGTYISGDFQVWESYPPAPRHQQRTVYLPTQRTETLREAMIRRNRTIMESSINSYGGGKQDSILPVVSVPGGTPQVPDLSGYVTSNEDLREMLALCRSKRVKEIRTFGPDNSVGTPDQWNRLRAQYYYAYLPEITSYTINRGMAWAGQSYDTDRLEDTLRKSLGGGVIGDSVVGIQANPEEVWDPITEETTFTRFVTEMRVDFGNLRQAVPELSPIKSFDINIECQVATEGMGATPAGIEGRVMLKDWSTNQWVELAINDVGSTLGGYKFGAETQLGFDAPISRATRRKFTVVVNSSRFIDSTGRVSLLLRHEGPVAFDSSYDLVQLIGSPDQIITPPGGDGSYGTIPGGGYYPIHDGDCPDCIMGTGELVIGDYNMDSVVDELDFEQYVADWLSGAPRADGNLDAIIDGDDFNNFMNEYTGGAQ